MQVSDLQIGRYGDNHALVSLCGKGDKIRQCPLWPRTEDALGELIRGRASSEPVFLSRHRKRYTRFGFTGSSSDVRHTYQRLPQGRSTPHVIRHTSACHLLQAGVDLNTIRAWLGHVSLETTNIYAEIDIEMKAKAMALCEATTSRLERPWKEDKGDGIPECNLTSKNYVAEIAARRLKLGQNRRFRNIIPCATSYRQAEIYARQGIQLDRATLGNWAGRACFHLKPVAGHMRWHLAGADRLFMNETTAPVLDPGRGKVKKGFFWAIACDDRGRGGQGPPIVLFHYAPGRGGEHAERLLQGFGGQFLQVDAYEGYDRLTRLERSQDHGSSSIAGAICAADL